MIIIPRPILRPNPPYSPTHTNCPNCCAVVTGPICEYCGTRFTMTAEEAFEQFHQVAHNIGIPIKTVR